MNRLNRIAKNIAARSQIVKRCTFSGNKCHLVIEESIYLQQSSCCFLKMRGDVDGFAYDVNRELNSISMVQCIPDDIQMSVDRENGLLNLAYECDIQCDDALSEKIKTSEWVVEGE